jgi:predicted RNA binding protein YcfA (HicA-like mRNA interferase family)
MTAHLPAASARKVIKALERAGFIIHHTTGGHTIMRHAHDPNRRVTVPMHNRDLKPGTMRFIIKQSGLSIEEFAALL